MFGTRACDAAHPTDVWTSGVWVRPYVCDLDAGHAGPHEAWTEGTRGKPYVISSWEQDAERAGAV